METKNLKTPFEPQGVTLRLPKLPSWNITELTGYEPKTTFWDDFSIADMTTRLRACSTRSNALLETGTTM